jgi:hypothetical protein
LLNELDSVCAKFEDINAGRQLRNIDSLSALQFAIDNVLALQVVYQSRCLFDMKLAAFDEKLCFYGIWIYFDVACVDGLGSR